MKGMLAGIIWVVALHWAPAPLAAQAAACCARDTAHPAGMHTRMQEWDRRLEAKLAEVDRAEGDRKVAAMAEAVRELLAQRREMHQEMAMHPTASPDGCRCGAMHGGHGAGPQPPDSGGKSGCPVHSAGGGVGGH